MSGIVGIFNRDGAPVDRDLLARMTDSLTYRGPDRTGIWVDGPVGFGHTLLATTFEHEREEQPCSLDGQVWIVADARVDDRDRLKRELVAKGRQNVENATDVELILHAYHAWGEDCVHHLLGDFSFAVWDGPEQKLFCARDHFGIKLFFFALSGDCLVFSNDLDCVRQHPSVSNKLNDLAIADFLLFECNQDTSTTSFADIQRVPPGHTMVVTPEGVRKQQYWTLPVQDEIRYARPHEYIDHFMELLDAAVGDRLRTNRTGIFMSGGLDSTTIAAAAQRLLSKRDSDYALHALTVVLEGLIPDDERYFATLTAEAFGIPLTVISRGDARLLDASANPAFTMPEPFFWPLLDDEQKMWESMSLFTRVALYGEDGDTLLRPAKLADMLRFIGWRLTSIDLLAYVWKYRRRPPLGLGLYTRMRRLRGREPEPSMNELYPSWLNQEFEARLNLRVRWEKGWKQNVSIYRTARSAAFQHLKSPFLTQFFDSVDMGVTRTPVEAWFPLFDMRLVAFLLALPSLPWCIRKELLREAARNVLPELVRRRPKTPAINHPVDVLVRRASAHGFDRFDPEPGLEYYVDHKNVPSVVGGDFGVSQTWLHLRPLRLNNWFRLSV